ncbi:MAG: alkane 1-monooxygenase [Bacteroidia bacterium]
MHKHELKYLLAYPIALLPLLGLWLKGPFAWITVLVVFGLMPLIELVKPGSVRNLDEKEEQEQKARPIFNWLLYMNLPILYASIGYYLWTIAAVPVSWVEIIGLTLSVGISCGTLGINVAHELGHRKAKGERLIAQALLLGSLYQHFYVEHNRGHHRWVATPHDPASARKGEWLYSFWFRSMIGGYASAWKLEKQRLSGRWLSWNNIMVRFTALQCAVIAAIGLTLGWQAVLAFIIIALIGGLLLETVNYLEHYGLNRKEIRPGVYEPVNPSHSWNANHPMGRIVLYELTRHADHHYRASRQYQILRHTDTSPQLPTGYPGMMLLSLVPPLWFKVMDKRVEML